MSFCLSINWLIPTIPLITSLLRVDSTGSLDHSFWDRKIRDILEMLIPTGRSIRDSDECTSTTNQRPDYGFLLNKICPFGGEEIFSFFFYINNAFGMIRHGLETSRPRGRPGGEEKGPNNPDDPKKELSDKLVWVCNPAPFMLRYDAAGPDLTLVAITPGPASYTRHCARRFRLSERPDTKHFPVYKSIRIY